jgi:hypothetical protein
LTASVALVTVLSLSRERVEATARLNSAAERLGDMTAGSLADNQRRAAIAWGYTERLRLGLDGPFRLIEAASRDPRLAPDERRTVSWGLLAHVLRGESHEVDPAALDGLGPSRSGDVVPGEAHVELIESSILNADNPRAAELAVRFAYTLAAAERLLEGSASMLAASVAALVADREIARREASQVLRVARSGDPIDQVRERRAQRSFYVERPSLIAPTRQMEREAIALAGPILDSLRALRIPFDTAVVAARDPEPILARKLFAAGAKAPPSAALAVTIKRYLPQLRSAATALDDDELAGVRNAEMLVAATHSPGGGRAARRVVGRFVVAAAVAMRANAQEAVWFLGDSTLSPERAAAAIGVKSIAFDRDVPASWHSYYLRSLVDAVADLRRVLPTFAVDAMRIRFRMTTPADSALAMHDPTTRTLHLPVLTAAGTLTHELAHELDRQSAQQQGHGGYRSDFVSRSSGPIAGRSGPNARVAASLRALTEELADAPSSNRIERPAEIFATRVDWFVAQALATKGISSGFLSAVQDELLTGHVVHPSRLRSSGRSRSLLTALEGMTGVAPFAAVDTRPSVQTVLRWSLAGPVDRRVAATILRGESRAWDPEPLIGETVCDDAEDGRVRLVRFAAESRARGWLRQRAEWLSPETRPAWARAVLGNAPWSDALVEERVAALRDYILAELASSDELPAGLSAHLQGLARRASCAD